MFSCLANVSEEKKISENLAITLKWYYKNLLTPVCSFLGGRCRAPWGPWLSILTPILLPYFHIMAGAGIIQYRSKTDLQIPSHKHNLEHWFCPKYIFFLKLGMIWIDEMAQGLRRWRSSVAWKFGSWGRATHVIARTVERVSTKWIKP